MTDTEPTADRSREDLPPTGRDDGALDLTSADYSVAFSPRNVAIGLAIIAGIVGLAIGRRRHRAGPSAPDPSQDS
jgi:hypothetical protein